MSKRTLAKRENEWTRDSGEQDSSSQILSKEKFKTKGSYDNKIKLVIKKLRTTTLGIISVKN